MQDVEGIGPIDEVPEADALEQHQAVVADDEPGLDTDHLGTADREADEADLIDQATVVGTDDEWDANR